MLSRDIQALRTFCSKCCVFIIHYVSVGTATLRVWGFPWCNTSVLALKRIEPLDGPIERSFTASAIVVVQPCMHLRAGLRPPSYLPRGLSLADPTQSQHVRCLTLQYEGSMDTAERERIVDCSYISNKSRPT